MTIVLPGSEIMGCVSHAAVTGHGSKGEKGSDRDGIRGSLLLHASVLRSNLEIVDKLDSQDDPQSCQGVLVSFYHFLESGFKLRTALFFMIIRGDIP